MDDLSCLLPIRPVASLMILLIDNYDSFVFNLARYFERLGCETRVIRNDAIRAGDVLRWRPEAIVLSPGPCTPHEAGCSIELVQQFWDKLPMLGVCLGHQAIAAAFGAEIVRSPQPMHGRTGMVDHDSSLLYQGLPNPLTVCRYHSLVVAADSLPQELEVTGTTGDGIVMSIRHRDAPVCGVQFHPESILTEYGFELIGNFLRMAGISSKPLSGSRELSAKPAATASLPSKPVTF